MHTITFYSYKGGVGRSLLVANAARYLATLGKSVFAIDLDLEAPGLHYKFELGSAKQSEKAKGVLDILDYFRKSHEFPRKLSDYVTEIKTTDDVSPLRLLRAGTAPRSDYWSMLSTVDWHDLFFGTSPIGVPFFLELKKRVQAEFSPDFLLIDARTGLTEMGGIATTLLPDSVICLTLASFEHLEGVRAVMRGIKRTTEQAHLSVRLVPVVSRFPLGKEAEAEAFELNEIQAFLNATDDEGSGGLNIDEVVPLHAEPFLEYGEQLLVGGKFNPREIPLLLDYLKLFSKIIPAADIRPHVGQLVQKALSIARLLDDPDSAIRDLEALTTYCADEEAFRALLKVYRLRSWPIEKILPTAALMWELFPNTKVPDPLLVEIVDEAYDAYRGGEAQHAHAEFAEAIWRANGMKNFEVGFAIANSYVENKAERALALLSDYVDLSSAPEPAAIIRVLEFLIDRAEIDFALEIIGRFKATATQPEFLLAWTKAILEQGDATLAQELLKDPAYRADTVRALNPTALYRVIKMTGSEIPRALLTEALDVAVRHENSVQLRQIAVIFDNEGRLEEFEARVRGRIPHSVLEGVLERTKRRTRRPWR